MTYIKLRQKMLDLSDCPKLVVGEIYEIHRLSVDFEIRSIEAAYRGRIGWYHNLPYEESQVEEVKIGMFLKQEDFDLNIPDRESVLYWFFVDGQEISFDSHTPNFLKRITNE